MIQKIKPLSTCRLVSVAFLLLFISMAKADVPSMMSADDILSYLEKRIAWHRQAVSLEPSLALPREELLKNSLQQHADRALKNSFAFAHALASMAETTPKSVADAGTDAPAPSKGILKALAASRQKITELKSALSRAKTARERAQLSGKLKLAGEHFVLLQTIADNIGGADDENSSLDSKITRLESAIPELNSKRDKPAGATPAPTSASGIFGLLTEAFSTLQDRQDISAFLSATKDLREDSRTYSRQVADSVRAIIAQGDAIGSNSGKGRPTYDSLLADMRKLTKVAVAASGAGRALDDCGQDLQEWKDLLAEHVKGLSVRIGLRISALLLAIGGLLLLSNVIARTLPRYISDPRRLHQLHSVRKIAVTVAIVLIAFLGLFTDLSSMGTFIGLLTAGLAVALQNVILSAIAYFQFFGAFGLKVGDRITISGVTGRVIKISMLRFYLMETQESDLGYLPTGRTVSFSNAILFQPLPFFRQTPGTNFVWSEIILTLAPDIDHDAASKKIHEVVNRVYANHLEAMQKQQLSLQRLGPVRSELSVPQIYLKITGAGLVLVIRYAVERDQESALHLQMTEELLTAIRQDRTLKIVNIG